MMVPQGVAQTSIAAMMLSVNRTKKAKRMVENIYHCVWYVSIDCEPGCMQARLAYLLHLRVYRMKIMKYE